MSVTKPLQHHKYEKSPSESKKKSYFKHEILNPDFDTIVFLQIINITYNISTFKI